MSAFDNDLANATKLLDALGSSHPRYLDVHTLYKRLEENISNSILYGDTDKRAALRAEIRYGLDKISLEVFNCTTDDIGKNVSSLQIASHSPRPKTEPSTPDREVNKRSNKFVFISHTTQDDDFVARLANDLKKAGQEVWHDGQNIKVSQSIPGEINKALADCEYFIIVLSPESVKSHWVLRELEAALAMKKTIAPVLLRDSERPALIQQVKYADFRKDYQSGLQTLLEILVEPAEKPASPALEFIFGIIERACYNGDLTPEQGRNQKDRFTRAAMKKQRGEKPMKPANPENTGEMFAYASQALIYDLLSLSDYHAEWPHLVVSDSFKKDSVKLLGKMKDQVLISSALVQQIARQDVSEDVEQVITPLQSLQTILRNIDDYLLSGKIPFHVRNEIERYFDDITFHLNKYLLLLHELANASNSSRPIQ